MPTYLYDMYRFEDVVEAFISALLTSQSITNYIQRGTSELPTPRVEIQFTNQGETGQKKPWPSATPPFVRSNSFNGSLSLKIVTNRKVNNSTHSDYRAKVRMLMHNKHDTTYWTASLLSTYLPNHVIFAIGEGASSYDISTDDTLDITTLNFDLVLAVKDASWPS